MTPRRCGCGQEITSWPELPFVGFQPTGDGGRLELRNCRACRSTLSQPVEKHESPDREVAAAE